MTSLISFLLGPKVQGKRWTKYGKDRVYIDPTPYLDRVPPEAKFWYDIETQDFEGKGLSESAIHYVVEGVLAPLNPLWA